MVKVLRYLKKKKKKDCPVHLVSLEQLALDDFEVSIKCGGGLPAFLGQLLLQVFSLSSQLLVVPLQGKFLCLQTLPAPPLCSILHLQPLHLTERHKEKKGREADNTEIMNVFYVPQLTLVVT